MSGGCGVGVAGVTFFRLVEYKKILEHWGLPLGNHTHKLVDSLCGSCHYIVLELCAIGEWMEVDTSDGLHLFCRVLAESVHLMGEKLFIAPPTFSAAPPHSSVTPPIPLTTPLSPVTPPLPL